KDEYYVLSFDIKSDVGRKVKTKFQQNGGSYTTYFSEDITLTADETYQYTSKEFKMTNKSDDKALFAVDMGNLKETLDTHQVEISNLCYKKVHHTEEEPEEPTETLNEEKLTLEDVEKNVTAEDKQDNIYELQVTEKPVSLVAGYKYKISFAAYSENARSIQYGVQRDGSDDGSWDTYGDADVTVDLEAGQETPIELEFVMPETDEKAIFFINYAQKDVLGNVTFKNMSLKAVAEPEETKPANMLSGGVKGALTGWADKGPGEFTVTLGDESAVEDIEAAEFQLQANDMNIVKGKTYKISFKITSEDARKVKTGLQRDGYGRGDEVYTLYGFSEEKELAAGTEELIEFTFTMSEATDDQAVFIIKLANPGGSEDEKTVTIKELSLVEVTK
ncbi:MAG: carbohydrate binding domain-containing protein, partial [Lachnospiraceae bacterium]|nr:carbohydrate binding domain-containing protein [Lachnospiraceae bacterium]